MGAGRRRGPKERATGRVRSGRPAGSEAGDGGGSEARPESGRPGGSGAGDQTGRRRAPGSDGRAGQMRETGAPPTWMTGAWTKAPVLSATRDGLLSGDSRSVVSPS